jgi:putative nucleotidyltransferase with HDIG domain
MDMNTHPHRRATDAAAPAGLPVDLSQAIYALSDALDLVGIDDVGHGKRVGAMAASCARTLGLDASAVAFLFDFGLLHDIGVSSTATHAHLVAEFDWESSQVHCEVGHALLRDFAPLAAMADPIRLHHTRWDSFSTVVEPALAEQANLVYLVDRVDALAAPHYTNGSLMANIGCIREQVQGKAGSYFAPHLVEAFLAASASEAFWLQLEPRGVQATLQDMLALHPPCPADDGDLRRLAEIFSRIVDAKSPFTAEHSLAVSQLARFIACRMGVPPHTCDKVEIAGLLHDLGKLRIPDAILDKPGALDERERRIIHAHSFETYQILRHIKGFEEIALWAAYHHEEADGSGYPFRISGAELALEARILRVADIFQAMVQDRPYRPGLSAQAAFEFLGRMAAAGHVESAIVAVLGADLEVAMAKALPGASGAAIQSD